ncbi:hypothetical protein MMC09_005092 [Bachmanniomyces sp. S44760]|nr:hypothetical protein [Bachmanniomyces sp. S44760]
MPFFVHCLSVVLALLRIAASRLQPRDLNAPLLDHYDYIVVGCGISGLVVANRLSENSTITVLCIEAGLADNYEPIIQDPVFVGADIGGVYDWDLITVPQLQLDGGTRTMPQGKVLGGGSILNAMCWNRGGQDDYNAWESLGNPGWGWDGLLPYFQKSETYTPVPSQEIAQEYSINYNPAVHGFSGPVQVSYPNYLYPQSTNFFAGLNYLGVPTEFDQAEGRTAGAAFVPTDLDPINQTRSDARRTYYDPYSSRPNFHVITGQHVTTLLVANSSLNAQAVEPVLGGNSDGNGPAIGPDGGLGFGVGTDTPPAGGQTAKRFARRDASTSNLVIAGVEFAPDAATPRRTVYATREVIVAAGALHSVQLLQLSGIGPAALLESLGLPVVLDLPGVGSNLQDHCLVGTFYPYNNISYPSPSELTTNATYNAEAEAQYNEFKTGPWTAGSPNALAFVPLAFSTNNAGTILANATGQGAADYLVSGLDSTIVDGFQAQKNHLVDIIGTETNAAYEIINNNAGSLTVSVMHPLSRGTCSINSADPFEPPIIDPRWLSNPVDRQILIEALLFNREILATPSMSELLPAQLVPPVTADEDALNQIINNGIRTEFHPSGTCAMLPLEQGGVVDSHLRVWGTQNLRVVDAGIFPIIPAAHLQSVVYAVAEKAADIIKADNLVMAPSNASSSTCNMTTTSFRCSALTNTTMNLTLLRDSSPILSGVVIQPTMVNYAFLNTTISSRSLTPAALSSSSRISSDISSTVVTSDILISRPSTGGSSLVSSSSISDDQSFATIPTTTDDLSTAVTTGRPSRISSTLLPTSTIESSPTSLEVSEHRATASVEAPSNAPSVQTSGSISTEVSGTAASVGASTPEATTSAPNVPIGAESSVASPSVSNSLPEEVEREEAIVESFIQWFLKYFHLV